MEKKKYVAIFNPWRLPLSIFDGCVRVCLLIQGIFRTTVQAALEEQVTTLSQQQEDNDVLCRAQTSMIARLSADAICQNVTVTAL